MEAVLKDSNDNVMKPSTSKDSIAKLATKNQNPVKVNKNKKSYEQMIIEAIFTLKERNGATIQGIKKYISTVFLIPNENFSRYVIKYLKKGIESGVFINERKLRYKLSQTTLKNIQKNIKNKVKKEKKISKKDKENIEPKENKKKIKAKNDKLKTSKEKNSTSDNSKKEKLNIEKPKKHKIVKKLNNNDKENKDDENEEPFEKKVKKEKKTVNIAKESEKIEEKKTTSKLKAKPFKTPTALVVAGNKLKKNARKSLIKLNMKKQKKILNEQNPVSQQNGNLD